MATTLHLMMRHPRQSGITEQAHVLRDGEQLMIGRQEGCQLRPLVEDRRISRRHCTLACAGSAITLINHSRNGTLLNGEKVYQTAPVQDGDVIGLGLLEIRLSLFDQQGSSGDPLIGQELNGFMFEAPLPESTLGMRYKAIQTALSRPVEIQLVARHMLDESPDLVKRFFRTARLAGLLSHPNVLQIYDCGEMPDLDAYFMAMEFVEGQTLTASLDKGLLKEDALRIASQIGSALAFGHSKRIIHRNVTPDSIFLGESGLAKLMGLGLAKCLDDGMGQLTKTGMMMGAIHYAAPEQALDASSVDHRADIYALGAVLYHMLCGKPPFDGSSPGELLGQLFERKGPTPIQQLAPWIDEPLAQLVDRALAFDPAERFATVDELLEAIDRYLRPVRASAQSMARARRNFLAMLPDPPDVDGLRFAAHFAPCEVIGGDFYDFFTLDDDRVGVVIGDVSGHGIDAAVVVGMAKTSVRIFGDLEESPALALARANAHVKGELAAGSFFSCCLGVLDRRRGSFTFVRGGHNPVLVYNPERIEPLLRFEPQGCALGMLGPKHFSLEEASITLVPGDMLLLYTDGVTEAATPDDEFFELERLEGLLTEHGAGSPDALVAAVVERVDAWSAGRDPDDDITLLAIKIDSLLADDPRDLDRTARVIA